LGIVVAELLQAGCPSCHPTNSVKALKDESEYLLQQINVSFSPCLHILDMRY